VFDAACEHMQTTRRANDPHQQHRLGQMATEIAGGYAWLDYAASYWARIDKMPAATLIACMNAARGAVERSALNDQCGGLISLLAQNGSAFCIVFVTDGSASHRNSRAWPAARLAAQREREACGALACLGIADAPRLFLRQPDANMPFPGDPPWERAVATASDVMRYFEPDLVLLPWRRDPHCDHRASWLLSQRALGKASIHPDILEYAIWLGEFGLVEDYPRLGEAELVSVDVSSTLASKRAAIAAHVSQITNLIADDPDGFRLTPQTIARLTRSIEVFIRVTNESH
jgi:LmbE family N-acetylglucosaminyl deacetylase